MMVTSKLKGKSKTMRERNEIILRLAVFNGDVESVVDFVDLEALSKVDTEHSLGANGVSGGLSHISRAVYGCLSGTEGGRAIIRYSKGMSDKLEQNSIVAGIVSKYRDLVFGKQTRLSARICEDIVNCY